MRDRELTQKEIDRAPNGAKHYIIGTNDAPVWCIRPVGNSKPIPRNDEALK